VLLLDSTPAGTARTDSAGRYEIIIDVPYRYIPEIGVQASYIPQRADIGVYLSSISNEKTLNVRCYQTLIKLELPPKAYPGRTLEKIPFPN